VTNTFGILLFPEAEELEYYPEPPFAEEAALSAGKETA